MLFSILRVMNNLLVLPVGFAHQAFDFVPVNGALEISF